MPVPRKTPSPTKKVPNGHIWFFTERHWSQECCHSRCHLVSFVMYISGAKFEDHCPNISGGILNSVFYRFNGTIYDVTSFLICIIQKNVNISKTKGDIPKKEIAILL